MLHIKARHSSSEGTFGTEIIKWSWKDLKHTIEHWRRSVPPRHISRWDLNSWESGDWTLKCLTPSSGSSEEGSIYKRQLWFTTWPWRQIVCCEKKEDCLCRCLLQIQIVRCPYQFLTTLSVYGPCAGLMTDSYRWLVPLSIKQTVAWVGFTDPAVASGVSRGSSPAGTFARSQVHSVIPCIKHEHRPICSPAPSLDCIKTCNFWYIIIM